MSNLTLLFVLVITKEKERNTHYAMCGKGMVNDQAIWEIEILKHIYFETFYMKYSVLFLYNELLNNSCSCWNCSENNTLPHYI